MERLRSINLRIGFAAAILFAILAFNWKSERKRSAITKIEEYSTEVHLKPFRVAEQRPPLLPPATVLKPQDHIIEVPDLVVSILLPSTIPIDTNMATTAEPGNAIAALPSVPNIPPPTTEDGTTKEPPYIIVEQMPRFPGCEDGDMTKNERNECAVNQLMKFIYSNIHYPEFARQNDIEGTVYLQFVVEKDGSITEANLMRDIGGGCGEESLRVIAKMPKWLPGKQQGRPVRVRFSLPIQFKLQH